MFPNRAELIDFGRSLFHGRHSAARPAASRAFQGGVFAARMGIERDDNPYLLGTVEHIDWIDGYDSSVDVDEATDLD